MTGIMDKFDMSHKKAVTMVMVPAFIVSILFITGAGLTILDIVDAFVNNIGVAGCGLLEVLLIGWFFSPEKLRQAANEYSNFSVGKWWTYCLKIVTVMCFGCYAGISTKNIINEGSGGIFA